MERPGRRSVRLYGYDYSSPGVYYITICTHLRECSLGQVGGERVVLSAWGRIVQEEWERSPQVRPEIVLDEYQVMPNHFHAIFFIAGPFLAGASGPVPPVGASGSVPLVGAHGHAPSTTPGPSPDRGGTDPPVPDGVSPDARSLRGRQGERKIGAHGHASLRRPARSVGSFIGRYKGKVTSRANALRAIPGATFWQGGFYEHVIRDDEDLSHAREYIRSNPARWAEDRNHPSYLGKTGYACPPPDYVPPGSPYDHAGGRELR